VVRGCGEESLILFEVYAVGVVGRTVSDDLYSIGWSTDESRDLLYDFRFLTAKEVEDAGDDSYWYHVGNVLDLKTEYEVNNYLIDKGLMEDRCSTLIRQVAPSKIGSVRFLSRPMSQPASLRSLIPRIGSMCLPTAGCRAAGTAAITLPAVTADADKENRTAPWTMA
jgi:hypothetical protein